MNLLLIVAFLVAGFLIGFWRHQDKKVSRASDLVIFFGLMFLIFIMGTRIGADEEVIADLGQIGFQALIIAVGAIAGSVIFLYLFSFYLKAALDHKDGSVDGYEEMVAAENGGALKLTGQIMAIVIAGLFIGWILLPQSILPVLENLTIIALAILLLGVGIDVGQNRLIFNQIKALGIRLIIIPFFVALGSIFGAVIAGTLIGLAANETAAVGAGFGWYSLSAVLLTDLHSVELGSLAFLTNIIRELLALVSIPLISRYLGGIPAIGPGGATTMDVTLPLLRESSGEAVVIPAFINGVILSALVPILVPFLLSL